MTSEAGKLLDRGDTSFDFAIVRKIHENTNIPLTNLKTALGEVIANVKIWADDVKGTQFEDGIRNSQNIVLFLSDGFTRDKAIIEQMRLAHRLGKNIIRVKEMIRPYHAAEFGKLVDECPDDLKGMLGEEHTCIRMSHGASKRDMGALIKNASVLRTSEEKRKEKVSWGADDQRGDDAVPIIDSWLQRFAAACGIALPGAGETTKKWSITVRIILVTCAFMCFSRFGTTVGPAFLDYETIIQIVVDHFALVIFLGVSLILINSDDVRELADECLNDKPMLNFLKIKQRIATGISLFLTFALVLFGWTTYLAGFFHEFYLTNHDRKMVVFGLAHGSIWLVVLPLFFGSLFATLVIMFVVQELVYCGILTSFARLHGSLAQSGLHAVATARQELTISRNSFADFQEAYLEKWNQNRKLQRVGAVPFIVFWALELCLMAWSIWSLQQGFNADYDDERVLRMETHWNLVARLVFFVVHSLWFGAGALIVGFLPFGVNFYGFRLRQLCRKLVITDAGVKDELIAMLQAHDLNFRVWFLRTAPCWLPVYIFILSVNIAGHSALVARVFGAYDP